MQQNQTTTNASAATSADLRILFATRIGAPDYAEQLITEVPERIEAASAWALANGFDRLRVAVITDEPPNFAVTVSLNA